MRVAFFWDTLYNQSYIHSLFLIRIQLQVTLITVINDGFEILPWVS